MATVSPTTTAQALSAATSSFAKANPKSGQINKDALDSTPGGTTRNVVYVKPFPLVMASGKGPYLTDVDGHTYLDLCAEYSAGLFGHSHPVILKAMHDAIDNGIALGSANQYEGKLAKVFCERYPSVDRVRFSNSGTEAVATCLSLIRAYTGKSTFIVFQGGYHGGLVTFSNNTEVSASSTKSMNVPHKFVVSPYNNIEAMSALVDENKADLAAIVMEPMQGSAGCIPADVDFIKACRAKATESGAVLMFDEVMTSRMSVGGYQALLGIYPDMTTMGKYLGGGGCNFAAFGGKAEIMDMLVPGRPGGAYHSGTYNNNVQTMATALATMEQLWTPEVAQQLWDTGVWLRDELNALAVEKGAAFYVTGTGSLMNVHFIDRVVRSADDAKDGNLVLRDLFYFDMINKGFFLARRGMVSIMSVHTREQLSTFIEAVKEFLEERKELVSLPN